VTGEAVHANCLVVGTFGILIRGVPGSGKSELTDTLIDAAGTKGNLGVLVADDRVFLTAGNEQVIARAPDTIRGKMEIRGAGLVDAGVMPAAKVHLLVDLVPADTMERLPESAVAQQSLEGVPVPALICPANSPGVSLRLVRWGLRSLFPGTPDYI